MLLGLPLVLMIQVCWFAPGLADSTPTVTIPFVAREPDYFKGYGGKVIGASADTTTYAVNCLPDVSCHGFTPDLTVVYAPNTYGLTAQGVRFDLTSDCILVGSPAPTQATCIATTASHAANVIVTNTVTASVASDSSLGIYPAPLPVTNTGTFPGPLAVNTAQVPTTTQGLIEIAPTTGEKISIATESPTFGIWTEIGHYTATGTWVRPSSGTLTGRLNQTGPVVATPSCADTNGTVTVTVTTTVRPNIDCQCLCEYKKGCLCDCQEASSAGPTSTESGTGKNNAAKEGTSVTLMLELLLITVFWGGL